MQEQEDSARVWSSPLASHLAVVGAAVGSGASGGSLISSARTDWTRFSGAGVLAAIGQSFFATGVGMAMMIAYGAYIPKRVSLVRSALAISGSIVGVSLLATLLVFPLVFRYAVNPAQGPELVFVVLPDLFAEMAAGRVIGTLAFLLLALAALTPAIANMEPTVSWLERRGGLSRVGSVGVTIAATWFVGLASILFFNAWSGWHPFAWLPRARDMTFYSIVDFITSNVMLPAGALLTSVLVGWVAGASREREVDQEPLILRRILWALLRYVCPLAIVAVGAAALV
jgi:NSS family neurotransmitter:Na+ symporter